MIEREALRLCDRYVNEVVLGFELCPWAEPTVRAGRVGRAVCLAQAPAPADCLPFVDGFASASNPEFDIGFLLFPRFAVGWAAFDAFAERVRRADGDRRAAIGQRGGKDAAAGLPEFLLAAFHPDSAPTFTGAHQLVSFLRRTPDPMLQFVRASLIDRVKENQPGASADVARRNHDALVGTGTGTGTGTGRGSGSGADRLDAVVRAIQADRNATYARLGAETRFL